MFHAQDKPKGLSLRMSAELDNIDLACCEARRLLGEQGFAEYCFQALLVLREALANAVVHGSGVDAAKMVQCDLSIRGNLLTISVEDEGDGFPWRRAPGEPPSPAAEKGRGVCIMRNYSDRMDFNDRGNKVSLDILCKGAS